LLQVTGDDYEKWQERRKNVVKDSIAAFNPYPANVENRVSS